MPDRSRPLRVVRRLALAVALGPALAAPVRSAAAQALPHLDYQTYTLPNGLQVILHEDHSVPIMAMSMLMRVGSSDEAVGRTGLAHLFEHLMFMGTTRAPNGMYDRLLENAGANNNAFTSEDVTNYYDAGPVTSLPLSLWLNGDRLGSLLSAMDAAKVNLQRDVVKNERRQSYENVPYGLADETLLAALFPPRHPYHWPVIGSMADLTAASLQDVQNFFRTYYAPNNATITVAGDFDPNSARAWIARNFGPIPRNPNPPVRPVVPPVTLARDTALVLEDRVQIPRLYYRWHSVKIFASDDAPLDVLAYVLAGDKNSRLYKRLVYDMQVAQDVNATQTSNHLDGYFTVDVTPKPGHTPAEMARLVNEELDKVVASGITDRELARARNTIRARKLDQLASVLGKSIQFNIYSYFAGTPDYARDDAARYDKVTAAEVQRVGKRYLTSPKVVLTVVPTGQQKLMVQTAAARGAVQ